MVNDGSFLVRWARGFTYPVRGLKFLLAHPHLWPWVAMPILINLTLVTAAALTTSTSIPLVLNLLWSPNGGWAEVIWWTLSLVTAAMLFLVALVILYFVSGIIAIPFNDRLSQEVENELLGERHEDVTWRLFLGDLRMSIRHSLVGLAMWMLVMAALFLLELFPIVGSVLHLVLGLIASGFFLSREMMDGVMSRRRLSFRHKLRIIRSDVALMEGLGMGTAMLLWVPLLNCISLPVSVIGGTLMFCRLEQEGLLPGPDDETDYLPPVHRPKQLEGAIG